MLTKESLAAMLNGREYRKEITRAEAAQAKEAGLLVIFGASDDLLEFRGAFDDECGAYGGCDARVHSAGVLPSWDDMDKDDEAEVEKYFSLKGKTRLVTADFDVDGYTWIVSSHVPHAMFEITDDGEAYCRGIVIAIADLAA
jgi:hypothetical protein